MLGDFIIYLVCMWFGAGIGVLGVSLCLAASDRRDDVLRRGRRRWWR